MANRLSSVCVVVVVIFVYRGGGGNFTVGVQNFKILCPLGA